MGRSPNELVSRELPRGGILTATLPGWNWCYCPLPRAKPGYNPGGVDFNLQVKVEKNGTRYAASGSGFVYLKVKTPG